MLVFALNDAEIFIICTCINCFVIYIVVLNGIELNVMTVVCYEFFIVKLNISGCRLKVEGYKTVRIR